MYTKPIPSKPIAPDDSTEARWKHTSMRRKLIQGTWSDLLENELYRHLPADRREAWGVADMSSNALEQVSRQLAQLYHETPKVTHEEDITALCGREGYVTLSGFWQLMQRVQQYAIAMRECCVRIDVTPHVQGVKSRINDICYRIVTPDFVYAEAHPDAPDEMVYYQEYRLRYDHTKDEYKWIVDVIDIRDLNRPKFGMYEINSDGSLGNDVSEIYMGHATHEGESYPYKGKDGIPFIPVQIYRAEKTSQLWNAYDASQIAFGSLSSAVLWSFYLHLIRDTAWSQKYIVNMNLAGLNIENGDFASRRASVTTDPSSILVFTSDPDVTSQPMIGTFEPSADPQKMMESISAYESRIAASAGISADIMKQSGDPRSGYAISVSRSGMREMQKRYAPVFRRVDEELLAKTAKLTNRFLNSSLPEEGYRVQYQQIAMSPEEMKAIREDTIQRMNAGLLSPVDALIIMNPDLTEEEAKEQLIRIRRDKAEFM